MKYLRAAGLYRPFSNFPSISMELNLCNFDKILYCQGSSCANKMRTTAPTDSQQWRFVHSHDDIQNVPNPSALSFIDMRV